MKKLLLLFLSSITLTLTSQSITLDTNYGVNGYTTFDSRSTDHATFSQLLSDESILISSSRYNIALAKEEAIIVKYTPQGEIDTNFATNGVFTINHDDDNGVEIFIDASENIYLFANIVEQKIFKLTPNGVLDNTFGSNGVLALKNDSENFSPNTATIVSNGIIVGSSVNANSVFHSNLKKFDFNGNLDTTFGSNGIQSTTVNNIRGISTIKNDNFVVSGRMSDNSFKLVKHNSNGSIDTSFAFNGEITNNNTTIDEVKVKEVNDNLYISLGYGNLNGAPSGVLSKYSTSGKINTSFGTNGSVTLRNHFLSSINVYNDNLYFTAINIPEFELKIFSYDFSGNVNSNFANNGIYKKSETFHVITRNIHVKNNTFYITGAQRFAKGDVKQKHYATKYSISSETTSSEEIESNKITFKNPIENKIEVFSTSSRVNKLTIYSLDGKLIKTSNSNKIKTEDLSHNLYILNCHLENGNIVSKKIIKQ